MLITINPQFGWDENLQRYIVVSHEGQYEYDGPVMKFDRAAQGNAKKAISNENNTSTNYGTQSQNITAPLVSQLQKQAANPTGFNPTDINNMLVAGEQGAGGANSGITGEANLAAARTRNAGGFSGALDEAARVKNRQLSENALNVQNMNANQKLANQRYAQGELGNIAGMDTRAQLEAMGMVPSTINSEVNAGNSGWLQNTLNTINTLSGAGKAAFGGANGAGYARS
jgi:hypothetical protein